MPAARRLTAWAASACVALLIALPAAARTAGRARTEAQLKAVQAEIAHAHARARRARAERQRLTRALRSAELSESAARSALQQLQGQLAHLTAQRARLAAERERREDEMADDRRILAGELRAAYLIGGDEPLKLLLNQRDPALAGRMLAYYGYFGRARAELLARIAAQATRLESLDGELAVEQHHLAALDSQQSDALGRLDGARLKRSAALASLDADSRTQAERLRRLQRERAGLESLLRRLRSAAARRRYAPGKAGGGPFARLRGTLSWPVAGRLAASFGEPRAGGLTWEGDLIDAPRGAPVRAVSAGRVVFANWLPGLGLLIIVDHGGGYLSLYGHNERLYKKVGDEVAAGDLIAAAGDSGGSARPQLYFGIRKGDRPVDPRPWFRKSAPTP
jgi:murein hydrolase activator